MLLSIVGSVNGQNQSIKSIKQAQDARKNKIDPSKTKRLDPIFYVNPLIGTGGHGHTYPGVSTPFGMMQLSPDTRFDGWDGCGGYHYSDSIIYGFSHTHLSGTGVSDYGDLLIVPQIGELKTTPGYLDKSGYGALFSHEKELATAGLYSVELNNGIKVQLTTTERAGMHVYTFPDNNEKKYILLDLRHRDKVLSSSIEVINSTKFKGSRTSSAWASEQHFYYFLESSIPYKTIQPKNKSEKNDFVVLEFPKETKEVKLKVGMSAVDQDGAEKNLTSEIPLWDFMRIVKQNQNSWRKELGKIEVDGGSKDQLTTFYTALYHSFLNPNLFSDVDGRYRGMDNKIHQLKNGEKQYTVFSLWDTYRGTHPLFTIVQQERTKDFIGSFMRMYEESGDLPVWELAGNETECMIGYHSVSVMADAYLKGIEIENPAHMIRTMVATAYHHDFGKEYFRKNGYINVGDEPESVSKTLEYAYDDYCIARTIRKFLDEKGSDLSVDSLLIDEDLYNEFYLSSFNFLNVYNPKTQFMQGRREGLWFDPFDPSEVNFNYTEANSWQYSLYAPHAIGALKGVMGGNNAFDKWLDKLFSTESELSGRHQVDITGLIGQYAHGNEPSHHMAYLYNYIGKHEKTAYFIRRILNELYWNGPDGLSGNEDCGQMSSWYVLSSLGFYPIAPGSNVYDIGSPIFNKASIHLENNKTLNINYLNQTDKNHIVKSIQLNQKPIYRHHLMHNELMNGGELTLEMTDNYDSEVDKYTTPPTLTEIPSTFIPVPFFNQSNRVFEEQMTLEFDYLFREDTNYILLVGFDKEIPTFDQKFLASKGNNPIQINETTTINARIYNKETKQYGSLVTNTFKKMDQGVHLNLNSTYAPQYSGDGKYTLIDGNRGSKEYRTNDWQGYFNQNIDAQVYFDNARTISKVGISCLQDTKSWIFLPSEVIFTVKYEGGSSEVISIKASKQTIEELKEKKIQEFETAISKDKKVRAFSVEVKNYGNCPEWHLGSGNPTWLFSDEIYFK